MSILRFGLKERSIKIKVPAVFILMIVVIFFASVSSKAAVTITGNFDDTATGSDIQNPGINFLLLGGGDGRDAGSDGEFYSISSWLKKFFFGFPASAYALEPTDVSKVIVFFTNGNYVTTDVVDGSFSLSVQSGRPLYFYIYSSNPAGSKANNV